VLVALLFLPALVAIAVLAFRWRRKPVLVLAEAVPPAPTLTGDVGLVGRPPLRR
jgi:hypothetical protein